LMNKFVQSTFDDADVMLFVTEPQDEFDDLELFLTKLRGVEMPLYLVLNKIDTITEEAADALVETWKAKVNFEYTIKISALNKTNIDELLDRIVSKLPPGPEYYPKDQLTDRPERFFVSEIIREKILMLYSQEVPYSAEIGIESYQETKTNDGTPIARITALIFVERETQKMIILGKGGASIKKLGTIARMDIEKFIEMKVFLELRVKVKDNWRDDDRTLKYFGYNL
jgi:GTPase